MTEGLAADPLAPREGDKALSAAVLLDATFAAIPDGLAAFDRDLRLVRWNDAYFDLMGYPAALARAGTPFRDFISHNAHNGEYGATRPDVEVDFRMRPEQLAMVRDNIWPRNNGRIVRLRRVPLDGGGLFCVATDVTEGKLRELQLRQSELRLELLSESVEEGLLVHDGTVVVDANGPLLRMLGKAREQVIGARLKALFGDAAWSRITTIVDGRSTARVEIEWASTGGDMLNLQLVGRKLPPAYLPVYEPMLFRIGGELVRLVDVPSEQRPAPGDGDLPATSHVLLPDGRLEVISEAERRGELDRRATRMLVLRDRTQAYAAAREREQVADQLRHSQKLEALGTLAGGIAHDFNNILSAMLGFAYLVTDQARDEKLARYGERIVGAGNRAKELVQQMLTFSRRTVPERQVVSLADLVREARALLRASLPSSVAIDCELPENLPPVNADPTQLHQVIMNLGTNAAQAMGESGRLEFTLSTVALEAGHRVRDVELAAGQYVVLAVRDTGAGIAPELHERVFDPFFTTKAAGSGTGLGLSIVHGIVASHDGAVEVRSTAGEGTEMRVLLPCHVEMARAVEGDSCAQLPAGSGEHVLVVDDEPMLLELTEALLDTLGYRATCAGSGQQALGRLRERIDDFDLVLTDLTMPGMSGIELAAAVHGIEPQMPVVLVTGYGDADVALRATRAGVVHILDKPVAPAALAQALADSLRRDGDDAPRPDRQGPAAESGSG